MKHAFIFICLQMLFSPMISAQIQSSLEIYELSSGKRQVVYSDTTHFEAPNWSPDGSYLIYNSQGNLYRFDLKTKAINLIPTGKVRLNNDHGFSPDGTQIVFSADDGDNWLTSKIYIIPVEGGKPQLITPNAPSFWHGWSPDGHQIAYVGRRKDDFDIYIIDIKGGPEKRLTTAEGLDDGPDYSPDGQFIYYNSYQSGSMEIWRMNADGSHPLQLTDDAYSNWFPHPSPSGQELVFLSYLVDQGADHPPMKSVVLRLLDLQDHSITNLCKFTGGQGTINVPSWSPDGKQFAFVSYQSVP